MTFWYNGVILLLTVEARASSVGNLTCSAWTMVSERADRRRRNLPQRVFSGHIVNSCMTVICKMECYSVMEEFRELARRCWLFFDSVRKRKKKMSIFTGAGVAIDYTNE